MRSLLPVLLVFLCACGRTQRRDGTGGVLGTTCSIQYAGGVEAGVKSAVDSLLDAVDRSLNTRDPSSALARFNADEDSGASTTDPHVVAIIQQARRPWLMSGGAFDPVAAGGVPAGPGNVAGSYHRLRVEGVGAGARVVKQMPGLKIDPDQIAPGYAADLVASLLDRHGIADYRIEVGDAVRARGRGPDGMPWTVTIAAPGVKAPPLDTLVLGDGALAACGAMASDPRTGPPAGLRSVAAYVILERASMADAFAAALPAMGPEAARAWLKEHAFVQALLLEEREGALRSWATAHWPGAADDREGAVADPQARQLEQQRIRKEKMKNERPDPGKNLPRDLVPEDRGEAGRGNAGRKGREAPPEKKQPARGR